MSGKFEKSSFLFGSNSVFIEELYAQYLRDSSSVDPSWVAFFKDQDDIRPLKSTSKIIGDDADLSLKYKKVESNSLAELSLRAKFMIMSYREYGHYLAKLDPLGLEVNKSASELKLTLDNFGFTESDLQKDVDITGEFGDLKTCKLIELIEILELTYSGSIAAEFMHVENSEERKWLYSQLENLSTHIVFSDEDKKILLKDLAEVEGFEQYLHTKFPGAKRFSIEGGDASIIALEKAIEFSADSGAIDAVIGLAHRGRLSTLTKVMQKPYRAVLSEFMGKSALPEGFDASGDVKYHMGYSSDKTTKSGKKIHLSLTPNPSHLEAVNPVVAGKVRAKQDLLNRDRSKVFGILVHGDAAFCGQGVVAESLVMSGLEPYKVGGIFHVVINNQIGFTANAKDSRNGRYCTEVAKMVGAPIIHVNGDDIESVMIATKIASNYRLKFHKDVVVDIVCYRKYGHNEGDEPMYTQSLMYNVIREKQTPAEIYANKLVSDSVIGENYYFELKQNFKSHMDDEFSHVENYNPELQSLTGNWSGFGRYNDEKINTGVTKSTLTKLCNILCKTPKSFDLNKKLLKLFSARFDSVNDTGLVDWATAEQLAYATLLQGGIPVRLAGQDSARGTFSHRHAVLHSQSDASTYVPLNNISKEQALFEVFDSNLSEYAALGFEYGYSLVNPKNLVIWEGQFGDFANGAQIIFDQFISSSEVKWLRMSGLVCLLPHGMEGQGPEHSSARLERFLQLCGENNIQVAYPTTPASIFHLLRRQILRNFRKPLIVMAPKSLLRHKLALSNITELDNGTSFTPIIDEIDSDVSANKVDKIIFCSGKLYYDLIESRRSQNIKNIAIIRFEQLYPFETKIVVELLKKYSKVKDYIWCQEEPKNMGCWSYIREYLDNSLAKAGINKEICFVGRQESASPAVGYLNTHNKQQELLIKAALK